MLGFSDIWDTQNLQALLAGKNLILKKWHEMLVEDDINVVEKSKIYSGYSSIYKAEPDRSNFYLHTRIGNNVMRCIAQTRSGNGCFWFSGYNVELKMNDLCTLCGKENENMMHVLFNCKLHEGGRKRYISEYIENCISNDEKYCKVLANLDDMKLRNVFLFMQQVVSYRNFIKMLECM